MIVRSVCKALMGSADVLIVCADYAAVMLVVRSTKTETCNRVFFRHAAWPILAVLQYGCGCASCLTKKSINFISLGVSETMY